MSGLPEWFTAASLLPSVKEFKSQSSVTGARRKAISPVDKALDAWWNEVEKCRSAAPPPDASRVAAAKQALRTLGDAIAAYLAEKTGATEHTLRYCFGIATVRTTGKVLMDTPEARERISKAQQSMRELLRASSNGRSRIPAVVSLWWICCIEFKRLAEWEVGCIPRAESLAAWGDFTHMPTMPVWKLESSGGVDKRWTLRSQSRITRVDDALKAWWKEFKWLQKGPALKKLRELIGAVDAYLAHKSRPEAQEKKRRFKRARVTAAERLKIRAEAELARLQGWDSLLPPRVGALRASDAELAAAGQSASLMEARTLLPTWAGWLKLSNVTGKVRSRSKIVLHVDRNLMAFWVAFFAKDRDRSLVELTHLSAGVRAYLIHKGWKHGKRVDAVQELMTQADEELKRLQLEWPMRGGELPPFKTDGPELDSPGIAQAAEQDLKEIERDFDEHDLRPIDLNAVREFLNAEARDESGKRSPVQDRISATFGHSKAYAQEIKSPEAASKEIFAQYKREKKWVRIELAMIQATRIVNYLAASKASLAKHARGDVAKQHKRLTFFQNVISVADHVGREAYMHPKDPAKSIPAVLEKLGWTAAATPDLLLPMQSICTIMNVCKWRSSKTADIVGAIKAYGKVRSVFTGLSLTFSLVTKAETITRLAGGDQWLALATVGVQGASPTFSVLGVVGAGIAIPVNALTLYKEVQAHRGVTRVQERYDTLIRFDPDLAQFIDTSPFFGQLRMSLAGKLGRRNTRSSISATGAAVGIASGAAGIAIAVTGANAWNPLGWTLAGIAALAGGGVVVYKIVRKSNSKAELVDLRRKYTIPPFVRTSGEWDRFRIADLAFRAALNDGSLGQELLAIGYALLFILFGGTMDEARDNALQMGHAGIMSFIKG